MQLTATPLAAPTPPATPGGPDPWGFPALDPVVARRAVDGLGDAERTANRLIDRSIAVRTMLDRDLRAGVFAPDTVRAVQLLTRARDYALDRLQGTHLPRELRMELTDWIRTSKDHRLTVVGSAMHRLDRAVTDLLDDDEGNVREELAAMRTDPSRRVWEYVRATVDGNIGTLYEARDVSVATHVLRAAGGLA